MKKKRERLDVVNDILGNIQAKKSIGPTRLLQLSNLSPQMFKEYIEELKEKGLIYEESKGRRKQYIITEKGCRFVEKYKIFSNFIGQLGL